MFVNVNDFDEYLTRIKSKFLPKDSVFETITESVIFGETDSNVVLDDEVSKDLRRGNLIMLCLF